MSLKAIPRNLVCLHNPKSSVSEAFRTLRTNIQFTSISTDINTLMVASSGPSEGKTTIVSNLAISLAQAGKKVLLIDGDLRKPSIHKIFGLTNWSGLTNVLIKENRLGEVLHTIPEIGLDVITAGPIPPNPAELLGSKRMFELLEELKQSYDVVLIDTPPILAVTDGQLLASFVDGVLLIARSGTILREDIKKTKTLLDHVKANIIGTVLNNKNIEKGSYYYYYGEK